MARTSLLVHIVMIVIAGTIGFLYIYPMIGQIRENQDTAVTFSREVTRVSAVNTQLDQKLSAINSIPLADKQKLITYMPDTLDDVSFLRTMEAILIDSGIEPSSLNFGGGGSGDDNDNDIQGQEAQMDSFGEINNVVESPKTIQSDISVSFETDETTLYNFFNAVENSAVPFVVKSAVLAPSEGGGITAELVYSVHALAPASSDVGMGTNDEMMQPEFNDMDF